MHPLSCAVLLSNLIPLIFVAAAIGAPREPEPAAGRTDSQMITSRGSGIQWIRVHPPGGSPCPPLILKFQYQPVS